MTTNEYISPEESTHPFVVSNGRRFAVLEEAKAYDAFLEKIEEQMKALRVLEDQAEGLTYEIDTGDMTKLPDQQPVHHRHELAAALNRAREFLRGVLTEK